MNGAQNWMTLASESMEHLTAAIAAAMRAAEHTSLHALYQAQAKLNSAIEALERQKAT